jgi:release factor glutamine methyltransferase
MARPVEPTPAAVTGETIGDCVRQVQARLSAAGIEDAGREARRLVCAIAGVAPETVIMRAETLLSGYVCGAIAEAVRQRVAGMTIGRIAGERSFYGRSYRLNEATLEPRADSETVVEAVLETVDKMGGRDVAFRIADVGTGSGCLLISLLAELPSATGVGTDIAMRALAAARENSERHEVKGRAEFTATDGLEGLAGPFDILVSNPPYILAGDIAGLDVAVRDHDPQAALDGGADGLDVYRKIAARAAALVPDGWVFLEIGAGMRQKVCAVFDDALGAHGAWRVWRDINGHERCVARKTRSAGVSE